MEYTSKIQHVAFCVWLLLLSIMFSKFTLVVVSINMQFLVLLDSILLYGYNTFCLYFHQLLQSWAASAFGQL